MREEAVKLSHFFVPDFMIIIPNCSFSLYKLNITALLCNVLKIEVVKVEGKRNQNEMHLQNTPCEHDILLEFDLYCAIFLNEILMTRNLVQNALVKEFKKLH